MAQETNIAWCDLSWNPTHGCSRVSTGCKHCYAETLSLRYGQTSKPWTERNATENVLLKPHKLREPLSNTKAWRGLGPAAAAAGKTDGKLVFVNSMSDLFHEQIPDEYIARVFAVMATAEKHTFQVLTKRPTRMVELMSSRRFRGMVADYGWDLHRSGWPLPNVWLGVSIENRKWVGRADILRKTPATVRFISAEPLIGPLRKQPIIGGVNRTLYYGRGWPDDKNGYARMRARTDPPELDLTGIDWLILGGESGPRHRPLDVQWMRDLRDAAQGTAIGDERPDCALFVKQLGGHRPGTTLEDLPEDLRIREFPR